MSVWSRLLEWLFGGLFNQIEDDRYDIRGRPIKRPNMPRLARVAFVALAAAFVIFLYPIVTAIDNRPEAVAYRARGITVIHAELARLAPCSGCTQGDELVDNAPGKSLGIDTGFQGPSKGCMAIRGYYDPLLRTAGWQGDSVSATKTVHPYHLHLSITCNKDATYTVSIFDQLCIFDACINIR